MKSKVSAAREALGRGELKVIDGGNHITTLTNPEFGSSIEKFLRHGTLEVPSEPRAPEEGADRRRDLPGDPRRGGSGQ